MSARQKKVNRWGILFLAGTLAITPIAIQATTAGATPGPAPSSRMYLTPTLNGIYEVPIYKSGVIRLEKKAKKISVGNPGIADILILRNNELYVIGKALGSTNIAVWDSSGQVFASFGMEVTHDLESLKIRLHDLLPGEKIEVRSAQEKIVLDGQVSSLVRLGAAVEIAQGFLPECMKTKSGKGGASGETSVAECKEGSVVNLLEVGGAHQVMLEVKVAEMARDVVRRLDSKVNIMGFGNNAVGGAFSGGAAFPNLLTPEGLVMPILSGLNSPWGPPVTLFQPNTPTVGDNGAFFSVLSGDFFMNAVFEITKENGLAKILAEPTLTTTSGQQAEFLSGGEFPIPVPGTFGQTTIEFKDFGVGVKFLPVVLDSERISLKLNISVTELTDSNNVQVSVPEADSLFIIPALTKRSAQSSVELFDGQTIGIAGLINEKTRALYDKLPGAGDIPMLGTLFRSQEFRSGQTELVIFVTPHLARPIARDRIQLPTDSFVPPSDLEFYLLGRMEARKDPDTEEAPQAQHSPAETAAGLDGGHYGHSM
ncbi:MAG: type II and III secretion system protein family protein [Pseudomonadota bacterium]|nr:type II and III secretion system protein family protein [Pseudomonadota bacterium]